MVMLSHFLLADCLTDLGLAHQGVVRQDKWMFVCNYSPRSVYGWFAVPRGRFQVLLSSYVRVCIVPPFDAARPAMKFRQGQNATARALSDFDQ